MALVVEDGVVKWSADPLVTAEQADAYAEARGWSDWAALTAARKSAAILDGSTYVRVSFVPPETITPTRQEAIQAATTEAARLSLTGPLLGGQAAGTAARRRVKAGSVEVEYAEASSASLGAARLALVAALLRSAGARGTGGVNVRLAKS